MDLTGKRFGKILVLEKSDKRRAGHKYWLCLCDCGTAKLMLGYNLKAHGDKASCGCGRLEAIRKYITKGARFGRLVVIGYSHTIKGRALYKCKCDCGNIIHIKAEKLRSNWTRSCGCIRKESLGGDFLRTHGLTGTSIYNRVLSHRFRLRALGLTGPGFSTQDVFDLMKSQDYRCHYCGGDLKEDYHLDHKMPLSRGGLDNRENLCAACPSCNTRKGKKTHEEFVQCIKEKVTE